MKVVVFVDVQKDFVLTTGALPYKYPEEPNHQKIIEFAKKCRAKGYQLFATVDTHDRTKYTEGKPTSGYLTTYEGKNLPIEHCIQGTTGHQIIDGLVKDENRDIIIPQGHIVDKYGFGSFQLYFKLEMMEKHIGEPIEEVIVCGYCTSICVISNALMLRSYFHNVPVTVVGELCGDIDKESQEAAFKVMHNCMISVKSADCALGVPQDAA